MKESIIDAAEARRAYRRQWAKEHPEKLRLYQERYWTKRAAQMRAASESEKETREKENEMGV